MTRTLAPRDTVVVDAVRTPSGKGKSGGALAGVHPVDLLATSLTALTARCGVDPGMVDDVIAGCVTQGGEQAANIGRHAVLAAGFPVTVPATTVDRQCGSSQQATHFATHAIGSGAADVVIACGVESMSRAPMLSHLGGADRFGRGLAERFPDGLVEQGEAAELVAHRWELARDELDAFAAASHQRAARAEADGTVADERIAVETVNGTVERDETVRAATTAERLAELPPVFAEAPAARFPDLEPRITAGNSSPLTDGAAAVLLCSAERARALGLRPRARIRATVVVGDDPQLMLMGVVPATGRVLDVAGLQVADIDLFEVNEAFASVPLAWAREIKPDLDRLNVHGGAIALGHPLGASRARLLTTLVGALEHRGGRWGLQTMCEAGGMANATIVERLDSTSIGSM